MPETELKFSIAKAELAKLEMLPLLREGIGKARRRRLKSAYFDTRKWDLWKRGFSLRIRNCDGALIQTLKQESFSILDRGEWERPIDQPRRSALIHSNLAKSGANAAEWETGLAAVDSAAIDLAMLEETPLAGMIDEAMRARLDRRFEVEVERVAFPLAKAGAAIEIAIDRGEIRSDLAPGKRIGVFELEIELRSGDRRAAFALARELSAQAPLQLSLISKAERGQLLAAGAWGRSKKASAPRLGDDMTSTQAFSAICRVCLHDFMLNAAGLMAQPDGDPIEAVHQGRIALRRLRAAFALFRPIIRDYSFARMNAELKWLAGVFGAARDRDVMSLNAAGADRFEAGDAKDFFAWLEKRRLAAHRAVVSATRSKRWRIFLVDFCEWIDAGAWRDSVGARQDDMRRFVRKRLRKRRDALLEKGRDLESLAPEARHNARIIAKKLRYAAQFFARLPQVADRGQMEQLLDGLDELQAALGELQDEQARQAAARADIIAWRKAAGEVDPADIAAAERWAAPALKGDKQLNKAVDAYAKVARAKPF